MVSKGFVINQHIVFFLELIISIILIVIVYKKYKRGIFLGISIVLDLIVYMFLYLARFIATNLNYGILTNGVESKKFEVIVLALINILIWTVITYSIYLITKSKSNINTSKGEIKNVTND